MKKPNKAQFKRGNAYYCIVNNELKVYIDKKWVDSCFSPEEFRSFDDVEELNCERRIPCLAICIGSFIVFYICSFLAFEILVMKQ